MYDARARYLPGPGDSDESILQRHGVLVDRIARRFASRSGHTVSAEDLWSAGAIGLIDAARRFDASRDVRFETFAEHRIRGSIIDELRRMDHLPRRLRAQVEAVSTAQGKLGQDLGREPTVEEVAESVGIEPEEAEGLFALAMPQLQVRADLPDEATAPIDRMERAEAVAALASAVARLPERLRILLGLHYQDDLTYREIAGVLGVSQPRVCQLHGEAVAALRRELRR
jgi:RNA polymerase sigma factor for flagellar operon FliA